MRSFRPRTAAVVVCQRQGSLQSRSTRAQFAHSKFRLETPNHSKLNKSHQRNRKCQPLSPNCDALSQLVRSHTICDALGAPNVVITAAAAASAADVLAVGSASGAVYLFDRYAMYINHIEFLLYTLSTLSCWRSESLVCVHVFREIEAAVTGIALSRDGCDMRVCLSAAAIALPLDEFFIFFCFTRRPRFECC